MRKLVGTHLTKGKDRVYIANVGVDVLSEFSYAEQVYRAAPLEGK